MSDNIDRLLNHYEETNKLCRIAQKERDRYFIFTFLCLLLLFLILLYPVEMMLMLQEGTREYSGVSLLFGKDILQSFLWIFFFWNTMRYYQKVVGIERTYHYIHLLEKKLEFNRESDAYLEDYPLVLNLIHYFYQWFFPLIIVAFAILKVLSEIAITSSVYFWMFDLLISILLITMTILFGKRRNRN